MTAAQKTSPVMQRITDTAKPDEIPKAPKGDLGLSIDETNSGK
ncbi:MAG: hypothetical protein M5U26_14490 [Planctomycetota bacterium]|nr:hypothetical protein [Planctomycetota bacterium]